MSASIRAVVETWGEHVTYLSRDLEIADLLEKLAEFAEDGHDHTGDLPELSKQVEEAGRQLSDVKDICAMAAPGRDGWHKSIDPVDGGLRIYCD